MSRHIRFSSLSELSQRPTWRIWGMKTSVCNRSWARCAGAVMVSRGMFCQSKSQAYL